MNAFIEVHAIQSLPPSNINRDDTGAPKSAVYGGVNRARVSSQSWKRATREAFEQSMSPDQVSYRTKRIIRLLTDRIMATSDLDQTQAVTRATAVAKEAGITIKAPRVKDGQEPDPASFEADALVFVSGQQLDALAALGAAEGEIDKKAAKAAVNSQHGIAISLFGRMVAAEPTLNVDAATQVAHAISTHAVDPEGDFYTAVDDAKRAAGDTDAGAGMMGTIEFSSSTLYRYGAVSLTQLSENLGDLQVTAAAVATFVESFLTSVPSGKKNTMAADTLPSAVIVSIRDTRPVSLVGAFERPVPAGDEGFVAPSIRRMADQARHVSETYGLAPTTSWVITDPGHSDLLNGLGTRVTLPELSAQVHDAVVSVLQEDS